MTDTQTEAKRPTHTVYSVIGDGEKPYWHRVGAAWANKDGKGFTLVLDSLPLDGRLVAREVTEREER